MELVIGASKVNQFWVSQMLDLGFTCFMKQLLRCFIEYVKPRSNYFGSSHC